MASVTLALDRFWCNVRGSHSGFSTLRHSNAIAFVERQAL